MIKRLSENTQPEIKKYGHKSFWLWFLNKQKINVPKAFFLPFDYDLNNIQNINNVFQEIASLNTQYDQNKYALAIRSSGISEDSNNNSMAGHNLSILDKMSLKSAIENIKKIKNLSYENDVGIIIQTMIFPKYSGVLFTTNPQTYSKKELLISYTKGTSEKIVSGTVDNDDLLINKSKIKIEVNDIKLQEKLIELCIISIKLETNLSIPIDIEWVIDKDYNILIVQCRPLTGVFYEHEGFFKIDQHNKAKIPHMIKDNDKIHIRLLADKYQINISPAHLLLYNHNKSKLVALNDIHIDQTEHCMSYSTVLLFPAVVNGNIQRIYANKILKDKNFIKYCQRYGIRAINDKNSVNASILKLHYLVQDLTWVSAIIIQEYWPATHSGIIKKIDGQFIIEISKGQFLAKGASNASIYIISKEYELVNVNEVYQDYELNIKNTIIKKETYLKPVLTKIQYKDIIKIVKEFTPILNNLNVAIEFCILDNEDLFTPYLFDIVEENSNSKYTHKQIVSGVVSPGKIKGKIVKIKDSLDPLKTINFHYNDIIEDIDKNTENLIFVVKLPNISLLNILKTTNSKNIGFIFEGGSILSHFSIILRERGIPAINHKEALSLENDTLIEINTSNYNRDNPISKLLRKNIITSYINPDLDGVGSGIILAHILSLNSEKWEFVYSGQLNQETIYLLNHLNITLPNNIENFEHFEKIILVDTHHPSQLNNTIPLEKITIIFDHHLDKINEIKNSIFINENVGSVATLIVEKIINENLIIDNKLKLVLQSAIISNTINFKAPTTTKRDLQAFHFLENTIKLNKTITQNMLSIKSKIDDISTIELLQSDLKIYFINNYKIGISQLENLNDNLLLREDIDVSIEIITHEMKLDYFIHNNINLTNNMSTLYCSEIKTHNLIENIFSLKFSNNMVKISELWLRKSNIVPKIENYLAPQS